MATNLLAPNGLVFSRNIYGAAPTAQANQYLIRKGFVANNISVGDLVKTGPAGINQGYVIPSVFGDTTGLGVFVGVLPYFDLTTQQTMHGLNGAFQLASNPSADIPCVVISDPMAVYRIQVSGGTWAPSWRGQNINWLTGTNALPNAAGISVLAADFTTLALTSTLPLRIVNVSGVQGGPQDPLNVNPVIEVTLNPGWLEMMLGTGI